MVKKAISIPEGTRDLVFSECKVIESLVGGVNKLFNSFGYDEVITPTLEFYDTFINYPRGIKQEEMYKFFDNRGRILALKADGTIPIARLVSTKLKQCDLPLRLRYSSRVFRLNESLLGKRNESMECGVEFIGGDTLQSDIEILVIGIKSLIETGIDDFKIEIGNISIFNCLCDDLNIDFDQRKELSELIEQKKLVELDEKLKNINISDKSRMIFSTLPWLFGGKDVLEKGRKLIENSKVIEYIDYLENIYDILTELGYKEYIVFDLGIAPRIDYYSGIIFKGYAKGVGNYVLYGGRYDNLIKSYGRDLKAIGLSINIDRLSEIIDKSSLLEYENCLKIYYNNENLLSKLKEAEEKRSNGIRVELLKEVNDEY